MLDFQLGDSGSNPLLITQFSALKTNHFLSAKSTLEGSLGERGTVCITDVYQQRNYTMPCIRAAGNIRMKWVSFFVTCFS